MTPVRVRVKELREGRGWTQVYLCDRANITVATLSRIENGHTKGIDFETLDALATALEVHPAALIEKRDERRILKMLYERSRVSSTRERVIR